MGVLQRDPIPKLCFAMVLIICLQIVRIFCHDLTDRSCPRLTPLCEYNRNVNDKITDLVTKKPYCVIQILYCFGLLFFYYLFVCLFVWVF